MAKLMSATQRPDNDDFNAKSRALVDWFEAEGGTISTKIKLADLREYGKGRGLGESTNRNLRLDSMILLLFSSAC